jgi:hypothetical protein
MSTEESGSPVEDAAARRAAEEALRRELKASRAVRAAMGEQRQAALERDLERLSAATEELERRSVGLAAAVEERQAVWAQVPWPEEAPERRTLRQEANREQRRLRAAAEATEELLHDALAFHEACLAVVMELGQASYAAPESGDAKAASRRCLFLDEAA